MSKIYKVFIVQIIFFLCKTVGRAFVGIVFDGTVFIGTVFVGVVFIRVVIVRTLFEASIILLHVITESLIILPRYLTFSQVHVLGFEI